MSSKFRSKLEKLLLATSLATVMSVGTIDAQTTPKSINSKDNTSNNISQTIQTNKYKPHLGLGLDLNFRFGASIGNYDLKAYPGWEDKFYPHGGSMNYETQNVLFSEIINLGVSYKFQTKEVAIGPRIGFATSNLIFRYRPLVRLNLNWWNKVTLQDLAVTKTPAIGITADFKTDNTHFMNLTVSTYKYGLYELYYEGEDCKGCENSSNVFKSEKITDGYALKVSMTYYNGEDDDWGVPSGWGLYFETNGTYSIGLGASYNYTIPDLSKKR